MDAIAITHSVFGFLLLSSHMGQADKSGPRPQLWLLSPMSYTSLITTYSVYMATYRYHLILSSLHLK